ncbi:XRE family transcriptional regulator [Mycetocola tolaasinivorans]|uniref:XRE family transcriptional regulator n=2 Tax=Mycetocola tolaasinivorans TaxID=76635 RepID=A0A3L7A9X2_9MICO|nr:XRE family transcriptional regulator [Mycetocola tolaasinivorans]
MRRRADTITQMGDVREARVELGLSQSEAARRASVSVATWRRFEGDPGSVSARTRHACERVLGRGDGVHLDSQSDPLGQEMFSIPWVQSPYFSPRQAAAVASVMDDWTHHDLDQWIRIPNASPLHTIPPFSEFDIRVMITIGENRAYAAAVRERCRHLSVRIQRGGLPFGCTGPYIDEPIFGATVLRAPTIPRNTPELFDALPEGINRTDGAGQLRGDHRWAHLDRAFSELAEESAWGQKLGCIPWDAPLHPDHAELPALLAAHHPHTWLDARPDSIADH